MDIKWQYRDSHWAIGNIMSNKKGMNIDAVLGVGKERQKVTGEQTPLVMSGSDGKIAVGRSIPIYRLVLLVYKESWLYD